MSEVLCFGRAGVDFYALQEGKPFEEVETFRKSFGGSPANIAVGLSRLGVSAGLIGKVSNDMIGRNVIAFLKREGVDVSHVGLDDSGRLTGIAITEFRPENCGVAIYRNGASDLNITPDAIDASSIAACKVLMISGTALSAEPSRESAFLAVEIARSARVKVFFDLDYRPGVWRSETETAEIYLRMAEQSRYLVGNAEEFACFAPLPWYEGVSNFIEGLLEKGIEAVILKKGSQGSEAFTQRGSFERKAFSVPAKKPFGAGDAFAASLIHGILNDLPLGDAITNGSAAAALVVGEFGCAESMPDRKKIQAFLSSRG